MKTPEDSRPKKTADYPFIRKVQWGRRLQTKFSAFKANGERINYGNCLQTCLANILNLPIDEIPNIYTFYGASDKNLWKKVLNMWLKEVLHIGLELEEFQAGELNLSVAFSPVFTLTPNMPPTKFVIKRGLSVRNKPHTQLLLFRLDTESKTWILKEVWDPHPSDENLISVDCYYVLIEKENGPS